MMLNTIEIMPTWISAKCDHWLVRLAVVVAYRELLMGLELVSLRSETNKSKSNAMMLQKGSCGESMTEIAPVRAATRKHGAGRVPADSEHATASE